MARPTTVRTHRQTNHFNRTLAGALSIAAGTATPALADIWSWNTGNGLWGDSTNWSPNSVPGANPLGDYDIRIGNLPGVQNDIVYVTDHGGIPYVFDFIRIYNGMTLDTNGWQIADPFGSVEVTGLNSRLLVSPGIGPHAYDFITRDTTLYSGTHLELVDNGHLWTDTLNNAGGLISGTGIITMNGDSEGDNLDNNGTIAGSPNGGLTIIQGGVGRLNLDGYGGPGAESGQLSLATPFSVLTFEGDQLTDSFSGTVTMGSGSLLNMNMSNGWTADAASTFNIASGIGGASAQIDGGHFTFGGDLNIGGSDGHLRVLADATLTGTADVFVGTDDSLEFDGTTAIEGGMYTLSDGANIDFDGPTEVSGGTFNMTGDSMLDGVVNLRGPTSWSGPLTVNGMARQLGDATVIAPLTINANVFDMDGNNDTLWDINSSLTVNTQSIDTFSQTFDGTFNMNTGALGRLTINLDDPDASWTMNGTMNLAGLGILTTLRVAGSRMVVTGDLNMGAGIAQITADTAFQGADVSIAPNGFLRMRGATTVNAATDFSGSGTLQNWSDGTMVLHSGVTLDQVGLTNDGVLSIGESGPGIASVDRFANAGLLNIDLGGYTPATEHDLLLVTGGAASLGGILSVNLLALGGGAIFAPNIGDEFTIITALGGIDSVFSNDPVTMVGGLTYQWSVIYNPHTVVLRLDHIVPTPGSLALMGMCGLIVLRRTRRAR